MKKLIIIFLFIIFVENVFSQNNKFSIEAQLGTNYTYFKYNNFEKNSNHPRFLFSSGLGLNFKLSTIFSIGTSIAFEQKGDISDYMNNRGVLATAYPPIPAYNEWRNLTCFNYLSVPILIQASFGKKINYFIKAGLFASKLISKKITVQSKYFPEETQDYPENPQEFIKHYDYGILIGLGIMKPVNEKIGISIEIRDNNGICDIFGQEEGWSYKQILKTNSFNFMLGVKYLFNSKTSVAK
jgi:hypothetical protein